MPKKTILLQSPNLPNNLRKVLNPLLSNSK